MAKEPFILTKISPMLEVGACMVIVGREITDTREIMSVSYSLDAQEHIQRHRHTVLTGPPPL